MTSIDTNISGISSISNLSFNTNEFTNTQYNSIHKSYPHHSIFVRKNNISIKIDEIDKVNEHLNISDSNSLSSDSSSTKSEYYDIREKLHNKFKFKKILLKRDFDSHKQFIHDMYSSIEIDNIITFYDNIMTKNDMKDSDKIDLIVLFELDYDNFDIVFERYTLWKYMYRIKKHSDIVSNVITNIKSP